VYAGLRSLAILDRGKENGYLGQLEETTIGCPYCGESIAVLLDAQEAEQEYIEDCQVCCRPIVFVVTIDLEDALSVMVRAEDDAF
jgi:hypothetical protein